ncbi:FAD-binding oxidoreductase [Streptacidiphilus sp. NEAU-YB345]|uniref:FAD-binding oxidoreductase n=2 Tax=Streptacidiphilus fuscans TaxID=2789292 RepID=A0A931B097_9ACTN|nr:FAD-binding oxidoreductase [Streptacidiphilus fuscans]
MIGAACADALAADPRMRVAVVDRGPVAGGTTGAGEGNLLVSDKTPGPELDLALASARLWRGLADQLGARAVEYEPKGGLVVASDAQALGALRELAEGQRKAGVAAESVPAERLRELEPQLAPELAGGVHYPQDAQVQPALAAATLLRRARHTGRVDLLTGTEVLGLSTGRVLTDRHGTLHCDAVVNAAGTWGGEVAALAGSVLPVRPRRGFVLVTEPLPPLVRHKVYAADYVADVASGSAGLESSAVVEGTAAGPVLIGATRERVGFDRLLSVPALARLAAQATALFPALASVRAIRAYRGFRPYLPDHLPAIGRDAVHPWLFHACGHEGAGIGLAPATGLLIAQLVRGETPFLDPSPFDPARFAKFPQFPQFAEPQHEEQP